MFQRYLIQQFFFFATHDIRTLDSRHIFLHLISPFSSYVIQLFWLHIGRNNLGWFLGLISLSLSIASSYDLIAFLCPTFFSFLVFPSSSQLEERTDLFLRYTNLEGPLDNSVRTTTIASMYCNSEFVHQREYNPLSYSSSTHRCVTGI